MDKIQKICYNLGCGLSFIVRLRWGKIVEESVEKVIIEVFNTWDRVMRYIRTCFEKFIEGLRRDNK